MKELRELTEGRHNYDEVLDDGFFEKMNDGGEGDFGILGGRVRVHFEAEKNGLGAVLGLDFEGEVRVECDRCSEDLELEIKGEDEVKLAKEEIEEFDTAHYVYESIVLSLPLKRVHEDCLPALPKGVRFVDEEPHEGLGDGGMQKMADNPEWSKLAGLRDKLE